MRRVISSEKRANPAKKGRVPRDGYSKTHFTKALQNLYTTTAPAVSPRDSSLNSSKLFALAGSNIQRQKIESKESLTEADYRLILRSDYPYTAVVQDEQLESLISRDKVALLVARGLAAKSAA